MIRKNGAKRLMMMILQGLLFLIFCRWHLGLAKPVSEQGEVFVCFAWAVWGERNRVLHVSTPKQSREIVCFVESFMSGLHNVVRIRYWLDRACVGP